MGYVKEEALSNGKTTLMVHAWKESVEFYSKKGFNLIEEPYPVSYTHLTLPTKRIV